MSVPFQNASFSEYWFGVGCVTGDSADGKPLHFRRYELSGHSRHQVLLRQYRIATVASSAQQAILVQ